MLEQATDKLVYVVCEDMLPLADTPGVTSYSIKPSYQKCLATCTAKKKKTFFYPVLFLLIFIYYYFLKLLFHPVVSAGTPSFIGYTTFTCPCRLFDVMIKNKINHIRILPVLFPDLQCKLTRLRENKILYWRLITENDPSSPPLQLILCLNIQYFSMCSLGKHAPTYHRLAILSHTAFIYI